MDQQHLRIGAAARIFVLVALAAPMLLREQSSSGALQALLAVGVVWGLVTTVDGKPRVNAAVVSVLEASAVGVICGLALGGSGEVLGALAVAPFTAGISRGMQGVALVLSAQVTALVMSVLLVGQDLSTQVGLQALSWTMTGLGLGLVGTFLHGALKERRDPLAPYHYAQTLIRQLIDLSGGLDSGLDPVTLGGSILSTVRDELPCAALVVHVPRGDTLTPLVSKTFDLPIDLAQCEDLAVEAWAVGQPVLDDRVFAFPIVVDEGTAAVVAGVLSERIDPVQIGIGDRIRHLTARLQDSAVHLDTALLFAAFRDAATAEERRRLAREMHDGVAQDIASLGYLVDALSAGVTSPDQAARLEVLRERITGIVAEIRRSVVTLRTSVGASESLGTAIGSIARNLSEVSGVPIHVTLDERTTRLRPEIEAELFRMAQEAMNNAVKHAQASAIHVHCQVHAPGAVITVTDNGRGLQAPRSNSHGLAIMRERALLIGAELEMSEVPGGGLTVQVSLTGDQVAAPATPPVSSSAEVLSRPADRARIGA